MAKKSNKYWKERFELLEDSMNNKGKQYMKDTESLYHNTIKETEKEISRWYTRYANNEGITYQQATQILNGKELKEFHMDVKEYIEKGKTLGVSKKWEKELERASINVHVTRLQALKLQMQQQVEELTAKKSKGISDLMSNIYSDTFYKSAYEIQKGFGVASSFAKLDKKQIEKILSKPWAADGSNFSQRIWGSHRAQLVNKLHEGLTLNLIQGKSPDNLIKDIATTFNVDRKRAATLVYTEKAYFQSIAQRDSFENLGVEEYEIVATLDSLTSKICQTMDGKHFKLDDFMPGSTAPPFHPRCRTATAPYFDDEFEDEAKRAARDEDGKYYTVSANMKYDDWYKAFVDGDESVLGKIGEKNELSAIDKIKYLNNSLLSKKEKLLKIGEQAKEAELKFLNELDNDAFDKAKELKIKQHDLSTEIESVNNELNILINDYEFDFDNVIMDLKDYSCLDSDDIDELKKIASNITYEEKNQIWNHSGKDGWINGYIQTGNSWDINKYLMTGDKSVLHDFDDSIKTIDILEQVILKNYTNKDMIVHRFVKNDFLNQFGFENHEIYDKNNWDMLIKKFNIFNFNSNIVFKGFTSTSYDIRKNVFTDYPIELIIHVPKGSNCYLTTNKIESEIILNKGSEFKIYGAKIEDSKIKMFIEFIKKEGV